jgi:hypothetical protein
MHSDHAADGGAEEFVVAQCGLSVFVFLVAGDAVAFRAVEFVPEFAAEMFKFFREGRDVGAFLLCFGFEGGLDPIGYDKSMS